MHPSQSHDRAEAAEAVAEQFRNELIARGMLVGGRFQVDSIAWDNAVEVSVGFYHDGRITLDVVLPALPVAWQWPDDLCFFRGFEAHICMRSAGTAAA